MVAGLPANTQSPARTRGRSTRRDARNRCGSSGCHPSNRSRTKATRARIRSCPLRGTLHFGTRLSCFPCLVWGGDRRIIGHRVEPRGSSEVHATRTMAGIGRVAGVGELRSEWQLQIRTGDGGASPACSTAADLTRVCGRSRAAGLRSECDAVEHRAKLGRGLPIELPADPHGRRCFACRSRGTGACAQLNRARVRVPRRIGR